MSQHLSIDGEIEWRSDSAHHPQVPDSVDEEPGSGTAKRVRFVRSGSYQIRHAADGMAEVADTLAGAIQGRRALVVTTPTVDRLVTRRLLHECADRLGRRLDHIVLTCSEELKTQERVDAICAAALDAGLDREGVLVAVGGGVCLDLVTMAAATIRRGLSHLRVPTTLIGQIDAAVGVKGSLNFRGRKSYLGCYCPPDLVIVNQEFLAGLPLRHFRAGLAEIVKMAIVTDETLFGLLELEQPLTVEQFSAARGHSRAITWRSIVSMLDELERNLFEDQPGERLADFGHTFSPLIESASGFVVAHGEAVALDIALSTELAACAGRVSQADRDRIFTLLRRLGLPTFSPFLTVDLCLEAMEAATRHRRGRMNLIVPSGIGRGFCVADGPQVEGVLRMALDRLPRDTVVP